MGCQEEEPIVVEEPVIVLDQEEFHNTKLYSYNNTIPHIIRYYEEMDDDLYGSYKIEMFDSNFDPVWRFDFRDMERYEPFANPPYIYEDKLIVNVKGIVSVLDLLTGAFLWEVETTKPLTDVTVYNDELYILYYNNHLITVFDMNTGEELRHYDYEFDADAVYVDDNIVIAFMKNESSSRNAVSFKSDGSFDKQMRFHLQDEEVILWDIAESSDESEFATNVIDGDYQTSWHENVKGYGEKEWIELTRQNFAIVHKLNIYNGNHESEKDFEENSKIKVANISIGDGKSFTYIFSNFEYGVMDSIEFVKPITADYILITIIEAEPGTLFKNTSISEISTE